MNYNIFVGGQNCKIWSDNKPEVWKTVALTVYLKLHVVIKLKSLYNDFLNV